MTWSFSHKCTSRARRAWPWPARASSALLQDLLGVLEAIHDVELGRDIGWRFRRVLGDLAHPLAGALGTFQAVLRFLDGRLRTGDLALQAVKILFEDSFHIFRDGDFRYLA